MKDIIRMNQLAGILTEGQARKMMQVLSEADQPYKIISQKTRKNNFGNEMYDEYEIEINKETHTTPDGSTFDIETIGSVSIPQGEELDFSNPTHRFTYIETEIFDENGNYLERIPGFRRGGAGMSFDINPSIKKAKDWLNTNGAQLMSGNKKYQRKST